MASNNMDMQTKTKEGRFDFIWNGDKNEFLGRGGKSWGKIGIFYLIVYSCLGGYFVGSIVIFMKTVLSPDEPYRQGKDSLLKLYPALIVLFYTVYYSCLAAFFAICLSVFFVTLDHNTPRQRGDDTMIKGNPGMGFRPQPVVESTLIRFEQGQPESYKVYTDHIQAYLDQYENVNKEGEFGQDCSRKTGDLTKDQFCQFNIDTLGKECTWQKDFGYDEGEPCVLLKLNKVFDWLPELYDNGTCPEEKGTSCDANYVGLTCEGENPADKENIGPLAFYPEGFHQQYFPYRHQEGYKPPLAFVQFKKPKNGVLIQIWCKAWAENIYHHKNDKAGSIHFELLID